LPDQAALEFYKLAAQIIPVLWIGTVLERLDPAPVRADVRRAEDDARRLRVEHLLLDVGSALREADPAVREGALEAVREKQLVIVAEAEEVAAARDDRQAVGQRTAPYALFALLVAAVSEAFALYGVAGAHTGWALTFVVGGGLVAGGALLLVPLAAGWLRLWRRMS
jgi:hypothetical protein